MRISLCMIVRDEADFIGECLASARGAVDEIVVVDTGSVDATPMLAQAAGARVFPFPWCDDFAAARNASIARARGDWVLWLDADERLAPGSAASIRAAAADDGLDCGFVFLHNAASLQASAQAVLSGQARSGSPVLHPRLLRRTPDLRFVGVVHEQLDEWLRPRLEAGRTRVLDAHVVHLGYAPELRVARQKGERNIRLLERRAAVDPQDFLACGYLAQERLQTGDADRAWAAVEEGWRRLLRADPGTRQPALVLACARAQLQLARGAPGDVLWTVEQAVPWCGEHPDLLLLRGLAQVCLALQESHPDARERALQAAEHSYRDAWERGHLVYAQAYLAGSRRAAAAMGLGMVAFLKDEPRQAEERYQAALAEEPESQAALLGYAEALAASGRANEALALARSHLGEAPDAWLVAAQAAEQLGQIEECGRFFLGARRRLATGYALPHRNQEHWALQCRLLAYVGRPQASRGALGAVCAALAGQDLRPAVRTPLLIGPAGRARAAQPAADPGSAAGEDAGPFTFLGRERAWVEVLLRNLARLGRSEDLRRLSGFPLFPIAEPDRRIGQSQSAREGA